MALDDFKNGLISANDYLSTRHHINTDVVGQMGENAKVVIQGQADFTLKEIICNLLAGRGLKLPSLQICLSVNLKAILGIPNLQAELYAALAELDAALSQFMDHTGIDELLGRINGMIAEATDIANMINFCASPIQPIAIPNMLEQGMGSFLGEGKAIIDAIGEMFPDNVGGCLGVGGVGLSSSGVQFDAVATGVFGGQAFNTSLFKGGLLGQLSVPSTYQKLVDGTLDDDMISAIKANISQIKNQITSLIEKENNVRGIQNSNDPNSLGGSQFPNDSNANSTNIGVMHNASSAGIQGNTQIANSLKTAYDRLAGYPVIAEDGTVYNNIFELFLEPGIINLLDRNINPIPTISDMKPVYNYCGEIIGYTEDVTIQAPQQSTGVTPIAVDNPGFNAGGLSTSETLTGNVNTASAIVTTSPDGTTTSIDIPTDISQLTDLTGLLSSGFSGDYSDLTNTPSLSEVAISGNYNDLIAPPFIPRDVSHLSDNSNLLDHFSGSYNDLTNKPTLFSGSYNDLTNKPTIPSVPTVVSSFTNDAGYTRLLSTPPATAVGTSGNQRGDIAYSSTHVFLCIQDYDGISNIWIRSPVEAW